MTQKEINAMCEALRRRGVTPADDRDSWNEPTATLAIKLLVVADVIALLVLAARFGHF